MAKRYDNFTAPYAHSRIPFLVAEVVTDGAGDMVDLICRWANTPAAACLNFTPEALKNQRFCRNCAPERLESLRPIASVAFSGSPLSFPYETALGRQLTVICYQLRYGVCGCILDEQTSSDVPVRGTAELLEDQLLCGTMVLEVGRNGIRSLSFSQRFCQLTGYSQREFLNRFAGELTALLAPQDRPVLLQYLLDTVQTGQSGTCEFRLRQKDGPARWVSLRAERLPERTIPTFHALLLDIDEQKRTDAALRESRQTSDRLQRQLDDFFSAMSGACALFFLPTGAASPEPVRVSRGLAELLEVSPAELLRQLKEDPLRLIGHQDREHLKAWMRSPDPSLRHTCHIQSLSGAVHILELSMEKREQDSGTLLVLSFSDVTEHRANTEALHLQAERADLLMAGGTISMDYDVPADIARFEFMDGAGRKHTRTVRNYQETLSSSTTLHPDSSKKAAAELRAACARPKKSTFRLLGRYSGQEYRQYQVSLVSLANPQGTIYHITALMTDITYQQDTFKRFQAMEVRREAQFRAAPAAVRLDLTANRILDARGREKALLRVLFGNTASDCLTGISAALPAEDQPRLARVLSREHLLEQYRQGQSMLSRRHLPLEGWVLELREELVENPENHHIEAWLRLLDDPAEPVEGEE